MHPTPTPPTPEESQNHTHALNTIIALAADLATRIHAAATTIPPTLTLDQASIALDRTARIIRRTVLLARRLHALPTNSPTETRKQVLRGVEDAIHRAARTEPPRETALRTELRERLDRPDFEPDLATRPIPELIEELARDLGVATQGRSFVFPRRTPADIDHLIRHALRPQGARPPQRPATRPESRAGATTPEIGDQEQNRIKTAPPIHQPPPRTKNGPRPVQNEPAVARNGFRSDNVVSPERPPPGSAS